MVSRETRQVGKQSLPCNPQTKSNLFCHQNSSWGVSVWEISPLINIVSKLPPVSTPWQPWTDPVKASRRLLNPNPRKARAYHLKCNSWGHEDGKDFREFREGVCSCPSVWTHSLLVYLKCTNMKKKCLKREFYRHMQKGEKTGPCPSPQGAFSFPLSPDTILLCLSPSLPLNKSFTRDGCRGA